MKIKKQKILTIGGGTGSFVVLSGLKKYDIDLYAVVSMADDGGSTGILRDELGVLPPGDIRQCLVALSKSGRTLRELFNFRYANGGLYGHNFGNIFLSTLEKVTSSFEEAIKEAGHILRIKGRVFPVTLRKTKLVAEFKNKKKIIGQHNINNADLTNLKKIKLSPEAIVNPEIIKLIKKVDKIILNPGDLYTSIIPNFLVKGLHEAIRKSKAKKIYVCNLMNKKGHTDNFTILNYVEEIEKYLGNNIINYVIYNKEKPSNILLNKYRKKGEYFVSPGNINNRSDIKFIFKKLISQNIIKQKKEDRINRSLFRHNSDKLAKIIINL